MVSLKKSKFVYRDPPPSNEAILKDIDKEEEESESSEEIDEEKVLAEIMQIEGGREFMSFVKEQRPIFLKSQSLENVNRIFSPSSSTYARRSQVNVAGPQGVAKEGNFSGRLSHDMPTNKLPSKSLLHKNPDSATKLSIEGMPSPNCEEEDSAQAKKASPSASDADTVSMQMISNRTSAMNEIDDDEVKIMVSK